MRKRTKRRAAFFFFVRRPASVVRASIGRAGRPTAAFVNFNIKLTGSYVRGFFIPTLLSSKLKRDAFLNGLAYFWDDSFKCFSPKRNLHSFLFNANKTTPNPIYTSFFSHNPVAPRARNAIKISLHIPISNVLFSTVTQAGRAYEAAVQRAEISNKDGYDSVTSHFTHLWLP